MNYCNQYISSQVAESPCSGFTASCKSQRLLHIYWCHPLSLWPQIAALHPNIWLSYPAKMASQVYGFYAARLPHRRLQSNVT